MQRSRKHFAAWHRGFSCYLNLADQQGLCVNEPAASAGGVSRQGQQAGRSYKVQEISHMCMARSALLGQAAILLLCEYSLYYLEEFAAQLVVTGSLFPKSNLYVEESLC